MKKKIIIIVSILILSSVYQTFQTEIDKKNAIKLNLKIIGETYTRHHESFIVSYKKKKYSVPSSVRFSIGDIIVVYYLPNNDEMVNSNKPNYLGLCLLIPAVLILIYINFRK